MAAAHTKVTIQPADEKPFTISSMRVPVVWKKVSKALNCIRKVSTAISNTSNESMARSVTTVPMAFVNDTPSHLFSTPQRANSPIRGTTRLTAYERKMEFTATDVRGCSSTGSNDCFHRHPLKAWARMPKGKESSIHHQFIS